MKDQINYTHIIASLFFGVFLLLFWGMVYPYHFLYQEQYQLFQFSAHYLIDTILIPGGFADYIGRLLTQFYYYPWTGAVILSLLSVLLQRLVWRISFRFSNPSGNAYYALTFLPAISLLIFLCDENCMLSFTIALNLSVLTLLGYTYIKRINFRLIFGLFMMPALFWLLGGVYIIFILSAIFFEWLIVKPKITYRKLITIILVAILLYFSLAFVSRYIVSYPMNRILEGLNYYRYPLMMPAIKNIILAFVIAIPIIISLLSRFGGIGYYKLTSIILFLIIFGGGALKVNSILDLAKEEAFAYDYMVRMRMWKEIIEKAEEKEPSSSMAMTCVNLALAKTGQLGELMFTFHQDVTKESLLTKYERDMTTPLFGGEVYYQLGMINTAQRFAYEAMESIPDYQKSVRCYKRLAETNIINGNYKVANQYLRILNKTFYYKQWAQKMQKHLYNEDAINNHVEFGRLRELRYKDDLFFNYKKLDVMLAFLLKSNSGNRMAFEYLMALKLVEKDLQGFLKFYSLGKDIPYGIIPTHFQEALIFLWTVNHRSLDELPWQISPQIIQKINVFASIYNSKEPGRDKTLYKDFGDTYWYFLLVQK